MSDSELTSDLLDFLFSELWYAFSLSCNFRITSAGLSFAAIDTLFCFAILLIPVVILSGVLPLYALTNLYASEVMPPTSFSASSARMDAAFAFPFSSLASSSSVALRFTILILASVLDLSVAGSSIASTT